VRRAEAAIRQLSEGAGAEQDLGPAEERGESGDDDEEEEDRRRHRGGLAERLRPTTVQGIQAALASGLALLAGEVLFSSRPYWVVVTAFVVSMGSGTFGDTLSRGFQRTLGTLLGAVVGFFSASVAFGNLYLEVPLMLVSISLAFYLVPVSYAMMTFWVTVVLAVAYGLMGRLDSGILALRFLDTLVGSVIGLAVSALVLPTKTSDRIREGTAEFLDALEDYLRDRVDRLAGGDPAGHPVEEAREVEGKLREVTENAATARKQAVVFGRSRADLDRWTTALTALSYYARHLADPMSRGQPLEEDRRGELLREAGERIAANLDSLSGAILDGQRPEIQDIVRPDGAV
jgi:uncharacterized membrane protein YccC